MPLEISIPFNVGEDGRLDTISGPDNQVRQHVLSLVNTSFSERVMLPTYGVDAQSLIFENMSTGAISLSVSTMVDTAFANWESGVELVAIVPDSSLGDTISQVDVQYRRKDAPDSLQAANSNTAIIGADGTVKDIVRG